MVNTDLSGGGRRKARIDDTLSASPTTGKVEQRRKREEGDKERERPLWNTFTTGLRE